MILADAVADFLAHPAVGPVIAGVTLLVLGYIANGVRSVLKTARKTEEHVLPHFTPPSKPDEKDLTVPARLSRLEEASDETRADLTKTRSDLVAHMRDEMDERETRRVELDKRLADGAQSMVELKDGQDEIVGKLVELQSRPSPAM